jgi:hypothetical protein
MGVVLFRFRKRGVAPALALERSQKSCSHEVVLFLERTVDVPWGKHRLRRVSTAKGYLSPEGL